MKRAYNRQDVANALMAPTGIDRFLQYEGTIANRGGVLPFVRRVVPDIGGDDISEFEGPLELGLPALLYDPLSSMAKVGAMATGDMKINPDIITSAAVDAPLMGSLLSGATGAVPRGAVLGANVFHGGPHRFAPEPDFPFGRPRLDKVGTGEGAQAYGYGFYSAEAPGVARQYRDDLAFKRGSRDMAEMLFSQKSGDVDAAIKSLKNEIAQYDSKGWPSPDYRVQYDEALAKLEGFKLNPPDKGFLYKLDIPDADVAKYLDWDKPLSEQPKSVQDALRPLLMDPSTPDFIPTPIPDNMPGYNIYKVMSETLGGDQAASEALRKAGIPGLKYFDQGSRKPGASSLTTQQLDVRIDSLKKDIASGGGQQDVMKRKLASLQRERAKHEEANRTRNYVTWDQDVLNRSKMLERDGITLGANKAPTAALPGLLMKSGERKLLVVPRRQFLKGLLGSAAMAAVPKPLVAGLTKKIDEAEIELNDYNKKLEDMTYDDLVFEWGQGKGGGSHFDDDLPYLRDELGFNRQDLIDSILEWEGDKSYAELQSLIGQTAKIDRPTSDLSYSEALAKQGLKTVALSKQRIEDMLTHLWGRREVLEDDYGMDSDEVAEIARAIDVLESRSATSNDQVVFDTGSDRSIIDALDSVLENDFRQAVFSELPTSEASRLPYLDLGANKGPTAALPGLLSQQDWMNSADQVTQDTRNLLSEMLQNKARIDRERQFYESGGI